MEVCGGHTHAIYKHGLEDLLPASDRPGARPGLPGVRHSDGPPRRCDRHRARARRDLHDVRRHDARARARSGSLLDAKAEGADVRFVYSPLDALKLARQNPDRPVVFFAIGFETTAPSTAATLLRARAEGLRNFSSSATT